MTAFENTINQYFVKIEKSFSEEEILSVLDHIAKRFDFDFYSYSRMFPKAITRMNLVAIGNYPSEWKEKYKENNYLFVDPVMKHCTSSTLPFYWKNIFSSTDREAIEFAKDCASFGLNDGFSLGINGNCGDFSLLNFACEKSNNSSTKIFSQAIMLVHAILPYIHEKLAQISPVRALYPTDNRYLPNAPLQELTEREKECLLWTAEGKTSQEISVILNIAESTVNFHLKNSVKKLDCINKTHAVAKAILLGLSKDINK